MLSYSPLTVFIAVEKCVIFTKENLNVKKIAPSTSKIKTIGILISSEKFIGYKTIFTHASAIGLNQSLILSSMPLE